MTSPDGKGSGLFYAGSDEEVPASAQCIRSSSTERYGNGRSALTMERTIRFCIGLRVSSRLGDLCSCPEALTAKTLIPGRSSIDQFSSETRAMTVGERPPPTQPYRCQCARPSLVKEEAM